MELQTQAEPTLHKTLWQHSCPYPPDHQEGKNNSQKQLLANISIEPVTTTTLPAYRRLITLLLPIRYQDKFFKDTVSDTTPSSLARCALWHETPYSGKRRDQFPNDVPSSLLSLAKDVPSEPEAKVIAGIQCRLEPVALTPTSTSCSHPQSEQQLYIQTLAVLSPYRSLGIAAALLDTIVATALTHYRGVTSVYAHVWESNEEALSWYERRGFVVEEGMCEGYYRKLRPQGARVVRRRVGVRDWLRLREMGMGNGEVIGAGGYEDGINADVVVGRG